MKKLLKIPIKLEKLSLKSKKVLFICDYSIWDNCEKLFAEDFLNNCSSLILKDVSADEKNLKKIISKAKNFEYILGFGSGTINDLCKLSAKNLNIPYSIIASAASMNGYLSKNASIKIKGHKKTISATLPEKVFYNLEILKSAPIELTKAGIGDVMCFYSCWFDWYLSHLVFQTKFDLKPFKILAKKMDFLVQNYRKFTINDDEFLEILFDILLVSGRGMAIAGGSYPASQSEHLIAHIIDMKYDLKNILHGQQIAVTTITSSNLQKQLLLKKKTTFNQVDFLKKEMEDFLGKKIAKECEKEFLQKTFKPNQVSKINAKLKNNWPIYQKKLQKIYFDNEKLKRIFEHFKIDFSVKKLGIKNDQYLRCVDSAKFIRNRLTCLDFATSIR